MEGEAFDDDYDYGHDVFLTCPSCGYEQSLHDCALGSLGERVHYRCRCCGGLWSEKAITMEGA